MYVLRFYLKNRKYGAVEIRLNYIEKNFKNEILNFDSKFKNIQDEIDAIKNSTTVTKTDSSEKTTDKPVTRKRKLLG